MCNTITNENISYEVIHYEGIVKGDFFFIVVIFVKYLVQSWPQVTF